jgi:hypothetical protein
VQEEKIKSWEKRYLGLKMNLNEKNALNRVSNFEYSFMNSGRFDNIQYFVMRRCPKSLKEELDNGSLSRRRVFSLSLDLFT